MDKSESSATAQPAICHYFVDEAGDPTLFNHRGRVIIGQEGCSRYFMLGILRVADPDSLSLALHTLREQLIQDSYFRRIPSMQAQNRKTALSFHAKDDIPEVRREVFAELMRHDGLEFYAVVRDKYRGILREVKTYKNKRYQPNEQYDQLVTRLFKDRLHKEDVYHITFATRGAKDRTRALTQALHKAKMRFEQKWDVQHEALINIQNVPAHLHACLQAADYFTWALQRCYEKREDRYIDFIWSKCRLVHDIDDHRKHLYGVYYSQKTPLLLDGLPEMSVISEDDS